MADSTVAPSGGDFSSLNAALSDAGTGNGDTITIEGDWTSTTDTTACTVADDNITIITSSTGGARHAGFDNEGTNYELAVTSGHCITVNNTGCVIDGLLILLDNTGSSNEGTRVAVSGGTWTITNTVYRAANKTSSQDAIYSTVACTINIENVYCMGFGRAGFHSQQTGATTQTWNAISFGIWDCGDDANNDSGGVVGGNTSGSATTNFNCHNFWVLDSSSGGSRDFQDVGGSGTYNWDLHNGFDSDTSGGIVDTGAVNVTGSTTITDGTPGAGDIVAVNDITTAPYDLRLQDHANNDAQEQHSNASGAGLTFGDYTTGDIAGTARSAAYDVGPHRATAAAGGDETIVADAGSYAWTGTAATLLKDSLVSAVAGSYAWTGTAATLLKGSLVSAEAGSYAWTGQAATLLHNQLVSAEAGSYAWTGQDVTLTHLTGETLTAEAGSYAWTGQAASLLYDRILVAVGGSYAWTGQDATLRTGVALDITSTDILQKPIDYVMADNPPFNPVLTDRPGKLTGPRLVERVHLNLGGSNAPTPRPRLKGPLLVERKHIKT